MTKVLHNMMRCSYLGHPYALHFDLMPNLYEMSVSVPNQLSTESTGHGQSRWDLVNRHASPSSGEYLGLGFGTVVAVNELAQNKTLMYQRNLLAIVVGREDATHQMVVFPLDNTKSIPIRRADCFPCSYVNKVDQDFERPRLCWSGDSIPRNVAIGERNDPFEPNSWTNHWRDTSKRFGNGGSTIFPDP